MKVLIVGDIHNYFGDLNTLIDKKRPDLILACGDFGFWPNVNWASPMSTIKPKNTIIRWCDGNHENFWELQKRTSDEIVPNVIYMPRGSTYTLPDGRTILFMGGALSIDKISRKIGIDWFPEELITQKDFHNLPDKKIDIFITHTCSKEIFEKLHSLNTFKINDPCYEPLSQLWDMYRPSSWFFGHFHHFIQGKIENTNWYCLGAVRHMTRWYMWLPE